MNQKGFAVAGIIYTLLVIFIVLIVSLLAMFNSRKNVLDELKNKVLNNLNNTVDLEPITFNPKTSNELANDEFYTYKVPTKGYYNFKLVSSNGSILETTNYLKEGEEIYLKVGSKSYNKGNSELYSTKDKSIAKITNSNYTIEKKYNDRTFIDTRYVKNTNILGNGSITITYMYKERLNNDLNKVRYIKDCIQGNSLNNINEWSEIEAIVAGENKALGKKVFGDATNLNNITDDNLDTLSTGTSSNKTCIIIDLDRTYNLDFIKVWHNYKDSKTYYNHEIMISNNGSNYHTIYNYETKENINGITVSVFENKKTSLVGDIYLPVKTFDGATWLRLFHHNNKNGTILWNAKAQVLSTNGYNALHKQSALYFLNNYTNINNKYELLLEYPDDDSSKYNRWIQTSDFTTSNTIIGYTPINIDFTQGNAPFTGLKFNGAASIISGNTGWYYAIGALQSFNGGIPSNAVTTGTVDLWVRIDN